MLVTVFDGPTVLGFTILLFIYLFFYFFICISVWEVSVGLSSSLWILPWFLCNLLMIPSKAFFISVILLYIDRTSFLFLLRISISLLAFFLYIIFFQQLCLSLILGVGHLVQSTHMCVCCVWLLAYLIIFCWKPGRLCQVIESKVNRNSVLGL